MSSVRRAVSPSSRRGRRAPYEFRQDRPCPRPSRHTVVLNEQQQNHGPGLVQWSSPSLSSYLSLKKEKNLERTPISQVRESVSPYACKPLIPAILSAIETILVSSSSSSIPPRHGAQVEPLRQPTPFSSPQSQTVAALLSRLLISPRPNNLFAEIEKVREQIEKAEEEISTFWELAKDKVLRPGVARGLIGVFKVSGRSERQRRTVKRFMGTRRRSP
ncbi:hypothetical protein BD410DRAFT_898742 [Rickenella mellea]|uniref:Uncharacterized protein n=1 Tax=Rickenella mellea TaxID=50990 RepID=A0A4Y7Q4A6_9AGAM|nr:hypothetical protein BD410DRAFT_898742 [Rickenella mellea]